mmetsp:Transcript_20528/g.39668  ORF Transcript_20528/g.39668 Transcript_20528/m.39668 type:complete len:121 (+) Transcript_20528:1782-2144(+)
MQSSFNPLNDFSRFPPARRASNGDPGGNSSSRIFRHSRESSRAPPGALSRLRLPDPLEMAGDPAGVVEARGGVWGVEGPGDVREWRTEGRRGDADKDEEGGVCGMRLRVPAGGRGEGLIP